MTEGTKPPFTPCLNTGSSKLQPCRAGCPLELLARRVAREMGLTKGIAAMAEKSRADGGLTGPAIVGEVQIRGIELSGKNVDELQRLCARYRGKYPAS